MLKGDTKKFIEMVRNLPDMVRCPSCKGEGKVFIKIRNYPAKHGVMCNKCKGTGEVIKGGS